MGRTNEPHRPAPRPYSIDSLAGGSALTDRAKGIALGLGASVAWGTVVLCARYLTDIHGVDPIFLAAARFSLASLLLIIYCVATGRGRRLLDSMSDAPRFVLLGLLSVVVMGGMLFLSTKYTYSINGVLLMNSNGIFIAALAFIVGERVPVARYAGLGVGLVGCVLIMVGRDPGAPEATNHLLGGALALGGALSWAIYTLLGKASVKRWGGVVATTAALSLGSAMMVPIAVWNGADLAMPGIQLWVLVYLAVIPTAAGFVAWYIALEYVPANLIGPLQYAAPVIGIGLGWALLHEPIRAEFALGTGLIFVGVWLATRGKANAE